jgi:hypothetical protein
MNEKSILTERIWLRLSPDNRSKLQKQADKNKRYISQELDNILDQYFTK